MYNYKNKSNTLFLLYGFSNKFCKFIINNKQRKYSNK